MITYTEDEALRDVNVDGYRLETWDNNAASLPMRRNVIGFRFTAPSGEVLWEQAEYSVSMLKAVDSDWTLQTILSWLTRTPDDTDAEWFSDYTGPQMAFANGDAKMLQRWLECDDGASLMFVEWARCAQCGSELTWDRHDRAHSDLCPACVEALV